MLLDLALDPSSADLGTSLVFIAIMFGMMLIAGANPKLLEGCFRGCWTGCGIIMVTFQL